MDQPADETAGARAAMLSHRLWMRRFGGDPKAESFRNPLQGQGVRDVPGIARSALWQNPPCRCPPLSGTASPSLSWPCSRRG